MLPFIQTAYLFATGSMIGWTLEFFYRRFFDPTNTDHKWLNPGFLTGPYLPIYGLSLILLYYLSRVERFINVDNLYLRKGILFVIMALCITALEFFTGLIFIVKLKIMLWDYRGYKGNIKGVICPLYTFFWLLLSFFYCFVIDPAVTDGAKYLLNNLQYSFFVGLFCGVFFIDLFISLNNIVNIAEFAREHNIIVYIDELKEQVRDFRIRNREKPLFFLPLRFSDTLQNSLERYREYREQHDIKGTIKDNVRELKDKGRELGEGIMDKGREIKEGVKDKGREIKEGVKDKGRDIKDKSKELRDGAKEKVKKIKRRK